MLQYRGSLKSCNYQCSYCPFSKHSITKEELRKDHEALQRFRRSLETKASRWKAIQIVPYGEALIHKYYWEEMAELSKFSFLQLIGAQTNLSFSIDTALKMFKAFGGEPEKLRLWCSFHPKMVTIEAFTAQCNQLMDQGIAFCVGAVGVPENIELLEALRRLLPQDIYLWINRMDGLHRRYTLEEQERFQKIDPWFDQELSWPNAQPDQCSGRLFVEADGEEHLCPISKAILGNWYQETTSNNNDSEQKCANKRCSCYLAYSGRRDYKNKALFGRFPLFRIPIGKNT